MRNHRQARQFIRGARRPCAAAHVRLIAAFDFDVEYRRVNTRLADLTSGRGVKSGQFNLFDPDREPDIVSFDHERLNWRG